MPQNTWNGIDIAVTPGARQLVILTHGGWKSKWRLDNFLKIGSGDGFTTVPKGTTLYFYVADGVTTKGMSVFREVVERPDEALAEGGLQKQIGMTEAQFRQGQFGGTWDAMRTQLESYAISATEIIPELGKVKDYALYVDDRPNALTAKRDHAAGTGALYHTDVDLATISAGVGSHKRHLSDVFSAMRQFGLDYQAIHVGFCRVAR